MGGGKVRGVDVYGGEGGGVMFPCTDLPKQECRWEWQFHMMGRSIPIGHPQWVWPEAFVRAYPSKAEVGTPIVNDEQESSVKSSII